MPAMPRPLLAEDALDPAIRERVARAQADVMQPALAAVAAHPVVVFGMAGNPFVRKARKALDAAGIAHHDIDHGGYFSQWRRRNALKMWTGWPTFPMVFVRGTLIGGADELQALIDSGELARRLA
jgi:glutaredoxin-related protein